MRQTWCVTDPPYLISEKPCQRVLAFLENLLSCAFVRRRLAEEPEFLENVISCHGISLEFLSWTQRSLRIRVGDPFPDDDIFFMFHKVDDLLAVGLIYSRTVARAVGENPGPFLLHCGANGHPTEISAPNAPDKKVANLGSPVYRFIKAMEEAMDLGTAFSTGNVPEILRNAINLHQQAIGWILFPFDTTEKVKGMKPKEAARIKKHPYRTDLSADCCDVCVEAKAAKELQRCAICKVSRYCSKTCQK